MIIDVFYKTYPNDYEFLSYSLKSVKRYLKGFRDIVIVTDHGKLRSLEALVQKIDLPNVKIYELSDTIENKINSWERKYKKLGINRNKSFFEAFIAKYYKPNSLSARACPVAALKSIDIHIGYEIQKAVKCNWDSWSDADAVLQLDSDLIFRKELSANNLFRNSEIIWPKISFEKERQNKNLLKKEKLGEEICWKPGTDWVYQKDVLDIYMCGKFFTITNELSKRFKKFVFKKTKNDIYDFFLNPSFPNFSEYELLGYFAETNNLKNNYFFSSIEDEVFQIHGNNTVSKFWSWGGVDDITREKIEAYQNEQ